MCNEFGCSFWSLHMGCLRMRALRRDSNPLQYSIENPMDRGAWGIQSMGSSEQRRLAPLHLLYLNYTKSQAESAPSSHSPIHPPTHTQLRDTLLTIPPRAARNNL